MPDSFNGESFEQDYEPFYRNFRSWVFFHHQRFAANADRVNAFKYVLLGTALLWWNGIAAANRPANLDGSRNLFYAKFRVIKSRSELKKELQTCKYVPSVTSLTMINKFQQIITKLEWPLEVQIDKFIRILPMNIKQFVVSRDTATLEAVAVSVKT